MKNPAIKLVAIGLTVLTLITIGVSFLQTRVDLDRASVLVLTRNGSVQGSGTVVTNTHVVTNAHVVDRGQRAEILYLRGDEVTVVDAIVVGRDTRRDLLLLRTQQSLGLSPLSISEGRLRSAIKVTSVGYPGSASPINATDADALRPTISRGVVSRVTSSGVVQHDAAINSGNSGGPLLDLCGQIVGINTAVAAGEQVDGIAFAGTSEQLSTFLANQNINLKTSNRVCTGSVTDFVPFISWVFALGAMLALTYGFVASRKASISSSDGGGSTAQSSSQTSFPTTFSDPSVVRGNQGSRSTSGAGEEVGSTPKSEQRGQSRGQLSPDKQKALKEGGGSSVLAAAASALGTAKSQAEALTKAQGSRRRLSTNDHITDAAHIELRVKSSVSKSFDAKITNGLRRSISLGRASTNDIVLSGQAISSRHAEIVIDYRNNVPSVVFTDLNSTNGTEFKSVQVEVVDLGVGTHEFILARSKVTLEIRLFEARPSSSQSQEQPSLPNAEDARSLIIDAPFGQTIRNKVDRRFSQMVLRHNPKWQITGFDHDGLVMNFSISSPMSGSKTYKIGRSDCNIQINSPSVSRLHAEIVTIPLQPPAIRDAGSSNGTFLDSQRIGNDLISLYGVGSVRVGSVELSISRAT